MKEGYRDSLYEIELNFLIKSLETDTYMLPLLSNGVPCINSDHIDLDKRIDEVRLGSGKEHGRVNENDYIESNDVPKPLLRLFKNLSNIKYNNFIKFSEIFKR